MRPVCYWDDPSQWFNASPREAGAKAYVDQQAEDAAGIRPLAKVGGKSLFVCPNVNGASQGLADDLVVDDYFMIWGWDPALAPAQMPFRKKTFWCYGFNTQLDGGIEDRNVNYRVVVPLSKLRHASETVLIAEKIMRRHELDPPFSTAVGQGEVSWKEFTTRNNGGGYILMADGHVGYLKRKDVALPPGVRTHDMGDTCAGTWVTRR